MRTAIAQDKLVVRAVEVVQDRRRIPGIAVGEVIDRSISLNTSSRVGSESSVATKDITAVMSLRAERRLGDLSRFRLSVRKSAKVVLVSLSVVEEPRGRCGSTS